MARLNLQSIKKIDKIRNTIHESVVATYTVFSYNEEKYLQIDTYGKQDRVCPEKISQSIQLDIESANYLIALLKEEFCI